MTDSPLQVQCTAWTGIAANLLPSGRTSASLFKLDVSNNCASSSHKRTRKEARLLAQVDVLIWDEASMISRTAFETTDAVLRDITQIDRPFGGKIVILGGDFRQVRWVALCSVYHVSSSVFQILPVIRKGSRVDQVEACIKQSPLWTEFQTLRLRSNMRVTSGDAQWIDFLLTVGDGTANDGEGRITLPLEVMGKGDIVKEVFGDSIHPQSDLSDVAILAPKNFDVDVLNDQVRGREGKDETEKTVLTSGARSHGGRRARLSLKRRGRGQGRRRSALLHHGVPQQHQVVGPPSSLSPSQEGLRRHAPQEPRRIQWTLQRHAARGDNLWYFLFVC